jgi:hypothetical protein
MLHGARRSLGGVALGMLAPLDALEAPALGESMHEQGPRSGSERTLDGLARRAVSLARGTLVTGVAALMALSAPGCGSLPEVPYVPQPARVTDPPHQLEEMLRTLQTPKPVKVEVTDADVTIVSEAGGEATTHVVHLAQIADMKVLKGDASHFAKLYDKSGAELFSFENPEPTVVLRFIDTIAALRAPKKP